MSRKRNRNQQSGSSAGGGENQSLRKKIKTFRHSLHGDVAVAFDKAMYAATGTGSLKLALTSGKDLQAAFVAAKRAAEEAERGHPIVDVPFAEEDE